MEKIINISKIFYLSVKHGVFKKKIVILKLQLLPHSFLQLFCVVNYD